MHPINTPYHGYLFRSRLEARWAVFFGALGIPYEYEKEGYRLADGTAYLPDFWLPEQDCWVEMKGQQPTSAEFRKAQLLALHTDKPVSISSGGIWIPGVDDTYVVYYDEQKQYGRICKKGAYCYDTCGISLHGWDITSPCSQDWQRCPHGEGHCPFEAVVEGSPPYRHLIRALYIAEITDNPHADGAALRVTEQGELQFLLCTYDIEAWPRPDVPKRYHFLSRVPSPTLPPSIKQYELEFLQLLSHYPCMWEWHITSIGPFFSEDTYRWCECPQCGNFDLAHQGRASLLKCHGDLFPADREADATPRLVAAYTAARQARFEYGEQPTFR